MIVGLHREVVLREQPFAVGGHAGHERSARSVEEVDLAREPGRRRTRDRPHGLAQPILEADAYRFEVTLPSDGHRGEARQPAR